MQSKRQSQTDNVRGRSHLGLFVLLICLAAGAALWAMAAPKQDTPASSPAMMAAADPTAPATPDGFRPIEDIRVGQRVMTTDGPAIGLHQTQVDPATWRQIALQMPNADGSHDVLEMQVLRPLSWMQTVGCAVGDKIPFELEEMGIKGLAQVQSISPCPALEEGPGRVVLATVTHLNGYVLELHLKGLDPPLEPTNTHRLYSEDRQAWVPAGDLKAGEHLRTEHGTAEIASITQKQGVHRVYNIEVETQHCYYVSAAEVLSHNVLPCGVPKSDIVVIGENQRRVAEFQRANGLPYTKFPNRSIDQTTDALLVRVKVQQEWIATQLSEGKVIIDIGPDPLRIHDSLYYWIELQAIEEANYPWYIKQ